MNWVVVVLFWMMTMSSFAHPRSARPQPFGYFDYGELP
jgi:hypothetical protein